MTIAVRADDARGGRRGRRRGAGGARRSRHHRGARGDRARAGLLGAVPRQFQIYRPARPGLDRQFRRASPAATTSRSARPTGNHWGEAVTLLETTAAGPYYFNFHQGDLGNFTVIGPSGSGKTVVLNFLLAQARKFRPRIIFFDKDRGAELFIRAIGGRYDVLRPGEPSGPQPAPARRQSGQPPVPDRLAGAARRRRRHRRDARGSRTRSTPISTSRSSIAGCATSPSCSAAATGRTPPICGRGCGPGGARASAPGCSTMPQDQTDLDAPNRSAST